jgi:hypothetical protein
MAGVAANLRERIGPLGQRLAPIYRDEKIGDISTC